jgi:hypothetical protein
LHVCVHLEKISLGKKGKLYTLEKVTGESVRRGHVSRRSGLLFGKEGGKMMLPPFGDSKTISLRAKTSKIQSLSGESNSLQMLECNSSTGISPANFSASVDERVAKISARRD